MTNKQLEQIAQQAHNRKELKYLLKKAATRVYTK